MAMLSSLAIKDFVQNLPCRFRFKIAQLFAKPISPRAFRRELNRLTLVAFSSFTVLGSFSTTSEAATPYSVHGIVEFNAIRSSAGTFNYEEFSYGFEITVDECKWLIKLGTHDPKVYDYRIVSSDGEDTYLLLSYETRRFLNPHAGWNIGDATVQKGNVPGFSLADEAGAIWLAYASACRLRVESPDGRREVPFANFVGPMPLRPGQKKYLESASILLQKAHPYLPLAVDYYIRDFSKEWSPLPISVNSLSAFTNVVYRALSFTNYQSLNLPLVSVVSVFRPHPGHLPRVVPQLCYEIRLTATNFAATAQLETFRPRLPGPTIVTEQRFNNGSGIQFPIQATNDWMSEQEAKQSPAFVSGQRAALGNKTSKTRKHLVPRLIIIGLLLALPIAIWSVNRRLNQAR